MVSFFLCLTFCLGLVLDVVVLFRVCLGGWCWVYLICTISLLFGLIDVFDRGFGFVCFDLPARCVTIVSCFT